jgi:endonuclease III-like uncharacterized protein
MTKNGKNNRVRRFFNTPIAKSLVFILKVQGLLRRGLLEEVCKSMCRKMQEINSQRLKNTILEDSQTLLVISHTFTFHHF